MSSTIFFIIFYCFSFAAGWATTKRCKSTLIKLYGQPNHQQCISAQERQHKGVNIFLRTAILLTFNVGVQKNVLALKSDEIEVNIENEFLGLKLKELKVEDNILVTVQGVTENADPLVRQIVTPGMIIVKVGDVSVEGYTGKEVVNVFKSITKPTKLVLRDPLMFFNKLDTSKVFKSTTNNGTLSISIDDSKVLETSINVFTNETLRVERTNFETLPTCDSSAQLGDVLELSYSLRQVSKISPYKVGSVFSGTNPDYSLAKDKSIFLVLGKGSKNQDLPLGFDVGLRGMCIGEARRIHIPPSLAFASDKKFDLAQTRSTTIRKNQPLILDAKLISINGKVQL